MNDSAGLTRRQLATLGVGGGVAAVGAAATLQTADAGSTESGAGAAPIGDSTTQSAGTEPFYGAHQSGIATALQRHARLIGLDLKPDQTPDAATARDTFTRLMRMVTDDAARMTQGRPALGDTEPELALQPHRLTITVGFGPRVFDLIGRAGQRPTSVQALPSFKHDKLQAAWGQSDIMLQVAGDDDLAIEHATRMLIKDSRPFATLRWVQRGFTSPDTPAGTPRNLMGQVDGTINPVPGTTEFDQTVWASGPEWFAGGTVLVLRRVAFDLENWDSFDRDGKEFVIGRRLDTGAPLTGGTETTPVDLKAVDGNGLPVIDPNSHVALSAARNPTEKMLRRGYSYQDGYDAQGRPDVGLLFMAYQANADTAFVVVQKRLAEGDLFQRWLVHIGSAVYAVPPGISEGQFWGQSLIGQV